jgi:MFS family permease
LLLIDAIGFGIVIPVFPGLIVQWTGRSLAGAAEIAGWISFLYASVQFLCGPVIGGLSDRFGRRPVLLASLLAFGADYLIMAFAPSLWWLVATRIIAGITGATFPTAYAYIADVSTPERRSANFGVIGMAFGFGFIIGPALGARAGFFKTLDDELKSLRVLAHAKNAADVGLLLYSATGQANGVDGDQLVIGPPFVIDDEEIARIARGTAAAIRAVRDEV